MAIALLLPIAPANSVRPRIEPRQGSSSARISSDAAFDRLASSGGRGRFLELPRLMFAIDRSGARSRVYWIDTRRNHFHFDYLRSRYLTIADAESFNAANYSQPDRRFVLGSVVRYPRLGRYGVELWEGDLIDPTLLAESMQRLQAGFHAPLTFKPNSDQQLEAAEKAGLPVIGIDEAYGAREELVLNPGRAVGRLVLVAAGTEEDLLPGDIALLEDMPIRLPPVAGIVSSSFTTPVNHVSLLAKSWGIPNAYRADARSRWAKLNGRQVVLDTRNSSVAVRLATQAEVRVSERRRARHHVRTPSVDSSYSALPVLMEQRGGWAARTGAKASNLGEVAALAARRPELGFTVPPGFSIPFAFYDRFVAANGLATDIKLLLADRRRSDPSWRKDALAKLRARFAAGHVPKEDLAAIVARRSGLLGEKGLFVRSSTNAEDLPGFNGAGLYDTIPNVLSDAALEAAVKTVWVRSGMTARLLHGSGRGSIIMLFGPPCWYRQG